MTSLAPCRFVPLGGLGEIGMNCMLVEHDGHRVLIDCGLTFDDRGLGADVVHSDLRAFLGTPPRLDAVVLTHGHEDHIGALPFLLDSVDVPIYGPSYALALVEERLSWDAPELRPRLHRIVPRDRICFGALEFEPYRVTHSTIDCTGLVIRTPHGVVVHSGDFKIDPVPLDGESFDFERLAAIREEEGIRLLMSDSTNALSEGSTRTEADVAERLATLIGRATGRVCVTLFASNIHRLRTLAEIGRSCGRRLCLLGRSLGKHARIAQSLGYLPDLSDIEVARRDARTLPPEKLLVLATGTQGEPPAAFARLTAGTHPDLDLEAGDTLIHSARIIPGHEQAVHALFSELERRDIEVIWHRTDPRIHASGHARRDEQKTLIEHLAPSAFVPIHGTRMHLRAHAALASSCGVPDVRLLGNGTELLVGANGLSLGETTTVDRVHRQAGRPVSTEVLDARAWGAKRGFAIVSLALATSDPNDCQLEVVSHGLCAGQDRTDLHQEAAKAVLRELRLPSELTHAALDRVREEARRTLARFFRKRLGYKPICRAIVLTP